VEPVTVDIMGEAFGARLAAILRAARHDQERSLRATARSSGGSFRSRTLKELETGRADLQGLDLAALASLYRIDLDALLRERIPLVVDVPAGTISTAGLGRSFDPGHQDGLLLAYLHLVRDLRDLHEARSIALRREDIEVLASGLRADPAAVLDRLGELMGSTVTQRRSAVAMFAAGAALIVLSTGAVALDFGLYQPADDGEDAPEVAVVTLAAADDFGDRDDFGNRGDLGGGDVLYDGPESALEPLVPATGAPATASELASPAPGPSAAPPVIDVPPSVTPGGPPATPGGPPATPGGPAGAGGGVPPVGDAVAGGPVVDVPVADAPPAGPSVPDVPEEADAAPGTPGPDGSAPDGVLPVDGQPDDLPPVDEPSAEVPSEHVAPGDLSPVDGPPVDEPSVGAPPSDLPLVDAGPGTDAPGSEGGSEGSDPGDPDPGVDEPTSPVGEGGTPGNSPEVGNTPNVGTPGNSGNPNAGGTTDAEPSLNAAPVPRM
jgi:hypothetical protein